MTYELNIEIKFYNKFEDGTYSEKPIILQKVIGMNIEYDLNNLTDTCNIKIPRKNAIIDIIKSEVSLYYETSLNKKVNIGSKVEIKYGYNITNFKVEPTKFYGYLSDIKYEDTFITLYIEDSMYLLKKGKRIQKTWAFTTLSDLINDITINNDIPIKIGNITNFEFNNLRVKDLISPSEILQMLKDEYSFYFYFIGDLLYGGYKYLDNTTSYNFEYPYNKNAYPIISKDIDNSIPEILNSRVIITSTQTDNSVISVYIDSDNIDSYPEIDDYTDDIPEKDNTVEIKKPGMSRIACGKMAYNRFLQFSNNSLNGSFTTFGKPFIKVSDIINIKLGYLNIEDDAIMFIDSINIKYADGNGNRQEIVFGSQIK